MKRNSRGLSPFYLRISDSTVKHFYYLGIIRDLNKNLNELNDPPFYESNKDERYK